VSVWLCAIVGYFIGGIPTGIWLTKAIAGKDPRMVGSGSSGSTNVSRVLGKKWGIVVLVVDALKGYLPVALLAPVISQTDVSQGQAFMAVGCVAGHVFTPYARFKGGKGVATAAGAMSAVQLSALAWSLVVWAIVFALGRRVSASSVAAAAAFPVMLWISKPRPQQSIIVCGVILAVFLIYTHRENIQRLLNGTEPRFR
jgi:glycerol-3-phosphate acyltransferase PlsY